MTIKRLPHDISSRIAAGEVIDRPASAIKELLENSLDAGSSRIRVYLEQGGKSSFCVEDDGFGIPFEQLPLAVERYATSKIECIDDLERIRTLGYRGEALASIATVSRLELRARPENEEGGVIKVEGGEVMLHASLPATRGTRIQVNDLFYNLPARRKFLKSASGELRHITTIVKDYALVHPDKKFQVYSEGKLILDLGNVDKVEDVLEKIWGSDSSLISGSAQMEKNIARIWWSALPGSRKMSATVFVNGRRVNDATVRAAINATEGSVYGDWLILIEMPPEAVDVNIHPTKQEVRFRDSGRIFQLVHRVAKELLLKKNGFIPTTLSLNQAVPPTLDPWEKGEALASKATTLRVGTPRLGEANTTKTLWEVLPVETEREEALTQRMIGQTPQGYVLFADPDGFAVMDPHAAHERILYEEVVASFKQGIPSQKLTLAQPIPVAIAMNALSVEQLLKQMGFVIKDKGDNGAELTAVPSIRGLAHLSPIELLRSALRGIAEEDDPNKRDREVWWRWARTACRDAVKLGQKIYPQMAESLLEKLKKCEQPYSCPHGRPTIIRISDKKLFEWFERG